MGIQGRAGMERRAIQLFNAWDRQDIPAVRELIKESDTSGQGRIDLVCSLLHVGSELIKAAADGKLDHYRQQLLGATLIAEAIDPAKEH